MKRKILVVEDDPSVVDVLRRAIADERTEILAVRDGAEAIRAVAERSPDLVLMDVCMPRMNGYDACRALRSDPRTHDLPIILLTSLAEVADELHGLKCGADEYIAKPFDMHRVRSRIEMLLSPQRQARARRSARYSR